MEDFVENQEYPTPKELADALYISNMSFPDDRYKSLTEMVRQISNSFHLPYSALDTGKDRRFQKYVCCYGGKVRGKTSKTGCNACFIYEQNFNGTFSSYEAQLIHNHPLFKEFIDAHRSCYSNSEINEINQMQKYGVPPGQIRAHLNISVNKNIFYNIRRPTILQSKSENLVEIISNPENKFWDIDVKKTANNTLATITYLNKRVAESQYSADILYIDDTMCTNIYGKPVELAICVDPQDHSQTLSFSLLEDKTKNGFLNFFSSLRKMHQKEIRIIVVDRNEPQFQAIKEIYPNTTIVFCLIHIRKNLLQHFKSEDEIMQLFDQMQIDISKCNDFVDYLESFIQENPEADAVNTLNNLLNTKENWLPSLLIEKGVYIKFNNNRSENFFGSFKQRYGFTVRTATALIKQLQNNASLQLSSSISSFQNTSIKYQDIFPFFSNDFVNDLGEFALTRIASEYDAFIKGEENDHCVYCYLKEIDPSLALPCRHDFIKETVNITGLNKRFFKVDICNDIASGTITCSKSLNEKKSFKYSDIIAKISPYATIADKNVQLQKLFADFFEKLDGIHGIIENQGMPPTLTQSGRFQTHPSKNVVLGGKPKEKATRFCKYCNQPGHYQKCCPLLKKNKEKFTY